MEDLCHFDDINKLINIACKSFIDHFNEKPTTAACAPGRVNLIGEHTDYSDGFVFPMALPLCTLIVGRAHKNEDNKCRIITLCDCVDGPTQVEFLLPSADHPLVAGKPHWANYIKGVVACYAGTVPAFDAIVVSSVPVGGGLSSSAAIEVAVYSFIDALNGKDIDDGNLKKKALACQKAEHLYGGMPCGIMDQFISFMGQSGYALLLDCRLMEGRLYPLNNDDFSILVTNSNVRHQLNTSRYSVLRHHCEDAARSMGKTKLRDVTIDELEAHREKLSAECYQIARHVVTENERCLMAASALESGNFEKFGQLMFESHQSLRDDLRVSCKELDELVEAVRHVDGVFGSRLTGAGFGGCTVTLVLRDKVEQAIKQMKSLYSGKATFYLFSPSDGARVLPLLL